MCLSAAVELVEQLHYLKKFVLNDVQTERSVQLSVILLFQDLHVLLQLWQTPIQTQQKTL